MTAISLTPEPQSLSKLSTPSVFRIGSEWHNAVCAWLGVPFRGLRAFPLSPGIQEGQFARYCDGLNRSRILYPLLDVARMMPAGEMRSLACVDEVFSQTRVNPTLRFMQK